MIRTKNARKGTVDLVKGKVKRSVRPLTRDNHLKAEGRIDQGVGKREAAVGRRSGKAGYVLTQVGNALKW
jgi:uncharacterized protein YjbJ (UPF0337 family)